MITACRNGDKKAFLKIWNDPNFQPKINNAAELCLVAISEGQPAFVPFLLEIMPPMSSFSNAGAYSANWAFMDLAIDTDDCQSFRLLQEKGFRFDPNQDNLWYEWVSSYRMFQILEKCFLVPWRNTACIYKLYRLGSFEAVERYKECWQGIEWERVHFRHDYEKWESIVKRTRAKAATKINLAVLSWLGQKPAVRERLAARSWERMCGSAEYMEA